MLNTHGKKKGHSIMSGRALTYEELFDFLQKQQQYIEELERSNKFLRTALQELIAKILEKDSTQCPHS